MVKKAFLVSLQLKGLLRTNQNRRNQLSVITSLFKLLTALQNLDEAQCSLGLHSAVCSSLAEEYATLEGYLYSGAYYS
ncbi:hypothetical protein L1887_05176 [Cichorium endivia]|nr:hypothetical protein L1887_05174 [Cichorium endivia]KAI3526023.1 hypothetical protein L1887_05176 [Cichorium endivia]